MTKLASKAMGCGIVVVLCGACLIVTSQCLVGHAFWGARWTISAIGWLMIAEVVIPVCERIKSSGEKK